MISQNNRLISNQENKITLLIYLTIAAVITTLLFIPPALADVPDNPNHDDPAPPNYPNGPTIEVVFLLDATGSMADEILTIKSHIQNIIEETTSGSPRPVVRIGFVTYRDHPPEDSTFVYRKFDFTQDIEGTMEILRDIEASGGGDGPEALADGLHAAVNSLDWSDDAARIIFLIGDAPPHGLAGNGDGSFVQGCPDGYDYTEEAQRAEELDITIHTIGCSGIEDYDHGIDVFKEIARITGGEYKRLEYKRVIAQEYYETEGVSAEYADASRDTTYDPATGTILVSDLYMFTGHAMKSAAMDTGVDYNENSTSGNKEDIPDLPGLPLAALIAVIASAVLVVRRYS